VTDHSEIDFGALVSNASLVFDTRNATSEHDDEHVHRL
jgi:UDP-N-acetyl-D-mannosaminuronate dehydrogenase